MKYDQESSEKKKVYKSKIEDDLEIPSHEKEDAAQTDISSGEKIKEKGGNERDKKEDVEKSVAHWRKKFLKGDMIKILMSGGDYVSLGKREKTAAGKSKNKEDYTGRLKVYGESGEYSKPFKEFFSKADHNTTLDALFGNERVGTEGSLQEFLKAGHAKNMQASMKR